MKIAMAAISLAERQDFLRMAEGHFRELNPAFEPQDDWKENYFERVMARSRTFARWITLDGQRIGFILFGLEEHRFLPRLKGWIYELYVLPEFRRQGVARICAVQAIHELEERAASKIELEVMEGNSPARRLWLSLGFHKVSERYVR